MSSVVIYRDNDGSIKGLGQKGARAYEKFRKAVLALGFGETLEFAWKAPRSPKFHALFFATLQALLGMQEQYEDMDRLLDWLKVGAGHCDFAPGPNGITIATPRSIAWDKMDDIEFWEFFNAVDSFIQTDHATAFLWPHANALTRTQAIETLLLEFRQEGRPQ